MSIFYFIDVTLKANYTPNNLLRILKEGKKNGFVYYASVIDTSPILDLNKAVDKVVFVDQESEEKHITVLVTETNFFIQFFESDDNFLGFSIGGFGSPWRIEAKCCGMRMIDFARYIRLLLKLCKDFTILELKTSSDADE